MSTHNIRFCGEIRKNITWLIWRYDNIYICGDKNILMPLSPGAIDISEMMAQLPIQTLHGE